ncbi:MAG: virulence RhuM family protein [Hyphomicrobium sp.]|nr:virulence RhuM family protein [Hyphomicrobium sp.]
MAKAKRTYEKPLKIDMEFDEALGRFAQTSPSELPGKAVEPSDGPVHLSEDDTGDRFLVYVDDKGVHHELRYSGDQPWFTQKQLAQMFGTSVRNVGDHVSKFISDGELGDSVTRKFRATAADGKEYDTTHYALDVAFYVGYRINSSAGVLFRKWATALLVRFATKGFVIDKRRLKEPDDPGLVAELRDIVDEIRAAGANAFREVKKIVSLCPDYDGSSDAAKNFFATIENKMLWVATAERGSKTSAELIMERADISKPNMGLTYITGKRGVPLKADVGVGTNYLFPDEQKVKQRIVELVLRYFEDQHRQNLTVSMSELSAKLDEFIKFNGWPLLGHLGKIRGDKAREHAKMLFDRYKKQLVE